MPEDYHNYLSRRVRSEEGLRREGQDCVRESPTGGTRQLFTCNVIFLVLYLIHNITVTQCYISSTLLTCYTMLYF